MLNELHHVGGKDAFGDGGGPRGGFAIHRQFGSELAEAECGAPDELAPIHDGDLRPSDLGGGESFAGEGFGLGERDLRAIKAADRALLSRSSGQKEHDAEQCVNGQGIHNRRVRSYTVCHATINALQSKFVVARLWCALTHLRQDQIPWLSMLE